MGLRDYLVFDGVPSTDFNIYVSGEGTFNAPEKMYNSYEVSGRSGDVQMFTGRYKNITVTYTCFYKFHKPGNDFKRDIDGFRAFLLSKEGYCRLEDTHHKEEYRMAVYKGGFEVNPAEHNIAAVFTLTFDCMPQRFLKSGEKPIEIAHPIDALVWDSFGGYVENPTLFPSSPLVQIYGSGNLNINDYTINVQNTKYGMINVVDPVRATSEGNLFAYYKPWLYNHGDYALIHARWWVKFKLQGGTAVRAELRGASGECTQDVVIDADGVVTVGTYLDEEFSFYQMGTTNTLELTSSVRVYFRTGSGESYQDITVTEYIDEVGDDWIKLRSLSLSGNVTYVKETKQVDSVMVDSTVPSLGNPLYIDMETGDAYKIENNQQVYVNNAVWVGEKLAVLDPGKNRILAEYTMSRVVIIPRWWTV